MAFAVLALGHRDDAEHCARAFCLRLDERVSGRDVDGDGDGDGGVVGGQHVPSQPSTPVLACGSPTGLLSGEPRWRR
jgi:hypothetical protein